MRRTRPSRSPPPGDKLSIINAILSLDILEKSQNPERALPFVDIRPIAKLIRGNHRDAGEGKLCDNGISPLFFFGLSATKLKVKSGRATNRAGPLLSDIIPIKRETKYPGWSRHIFTGILSRQSTKKRKRRLRSSRRDV